MKAFGTRRAPRYLLVISLVLFLVFAGLALYHKFISTQLHVKTDGSLLKELAIATIVFGDGAMPLGDDWPQWRGIGRDGVAPNHPSVSKWPSDGPEQLWQIDGGEGMSSFVVRDVRCYTMLRKDNREIVVCLNTGNGEEVWHFDNEVAYEDSSGGRGPRSTPALDGNRLYTVGVTGQFNCLDIATGKSAWAHGHDLLQEFNAKRPQWGVSFSPLIEGDLVITTPGGPSGNSIAAFNKMTGDLVWKSQSEPMGYSSPIAVTVDGVRQILVFAAKKLLSVSPQDGSLLWSYDWVTANDVNAATPVVFKARFGETILDYVFISSGYAKGCALLKITKDKSGFVAQPVYVGDQFCSHFSTPVRLGDYLYGFNEAQLCCLEIKTGTIKWSKNGFNKGSLLAVNDRLLVLGESGQLALFEANPEQPVEIARATPFPGRRPRTWTMPVLAEGRLFLRDEKVMMCLEIIQ